MSYNVSALQVSELIYFQPTRSEYVFSVSDMTPGMSARQPAKSEVPTEGINVIKIQGLPETATQEGVKSLIWETISTSRSTKVNMEVALWSKDDVRYILRTLKVCHCDWNALILCCCLNFILRGIGASFVQYGWWSRVLGANVARLSAWSIELLFGHQLEKKYQNQHLRRVGRSLQTWFFYGSNSSTFSLFFRTTFSVVSCLSPLY